MSQGSWFNSRLGRNSVFGNTLIGVGLPIELCRFHGRWRVQPESPLTIPWATQSQSHRRSISVHLTRASIRKKDPCRGIPFLSDLRVQLESLPGHTLANIELMTKYQEAFLCHLLGYHLKNVGAYNGYFMTKPLTSSVHWSTTLFLYHKKSVPYASALGFRLVFHALCWPFTGNVWLHSTGITQ